MKQILSLVATAACLAACVNVTISDSPRVSETRILPVFDQVDASRGIDVVLRCGPAPSAVLRGREDDVADTELSVENGVLTARRASMIGSYHHTVHAEITVPGPVVKLAASSGATLDSPACLTARGRQVVEASSGASIHLAGEIRHLTAESDSGAAIRPLKGERIDAEEAEVSASSGSVVHLCRVGMLKASAGSGASIVAESIASGDSHTGSGGGISMKKCD